MFDHFFFEETLPKQLQEMQAGITVKVSTHAGDSFAVKRVAEATPGYVVLVVYPHSDEKLATRRRPLRPSDDPMSVLEDEYVFDRIVLAYGSISSVLLTANSPDIKRTKPEKKIGFQFEQSGA